MVIKTVTELQRRMDEHSGNFNKEMENRGNTRQESQSLRIT